MYLSTVDCSVVVSLYPTYDMANQQELLVNRDFTINGNIAQFLWGNFTRFELPLEYIQDSDMLQINDWWNNNNQLVFYFDNTEYNIRIVNEDQPIQNLQRPYNNVWGGNLIVEVL